MTGILNIQIKSKLGDKDVNLKKIEHFLKKNFDKNLDLVVLPEYFSTGLDYNQTKSFAETEKDSVTLEKIKEFAKTYNTNIVAGSVIEKDNEDFYNTTYVINRNGEIVGKYRKIHLFDYMGGQENMFIKKGEEIKIVDLDFGKIGLSLCHDIRFPLHFKKLAQKNVQIVVNPSNWFVPNEIYEDEKALKNAQNLWVSMNRVRAFDNHFYLITSNQTKAVNENLTAIGNSLIIAPNAEVLSNLKDAETAQYMNIDLDIVKYYNAFYPISQID